MAMSQENQKMQLKDRNSGNQGNLEEQTLAEVYLCSCGKEYKSFPATYLHFRTKHNIRLSTKPSEKRRIIKIEGDIKKILYQASYTKENANKKCRREPDPISQYYQEEDQKISDLRIQSYNLEIKKIKSCVREYLNNSNGQCRILYEKLLKYLSIQSNSLGLPAQTLTLEKIPYLFNNFAMYYLPQNDWSIQVGCLQWTRICLELKKFSDWLYQKNYTELMLMYNN